MPGPIICRNPTCTFTFGAVVVDVSDHLQSVELTSEAEKVELRTFAKPKGADWGNQTDGITLNLMWSGDLYDALAPYVGVEGALACKPVGSVNRFIRATVKYGALPWGTFEVGQAVTVALPLIVATGDITYGV